jgi:hypothetical protein
MSCTRDLPKPTDDTHNNISRHTFHDTITCLLHSSPTKLRLLVQDNDHRRHLWNRALEHPRKLYLIPFHLSTSLLSGLANCTLHRLLNEYPHYLTYVIKTYHYTPIQSIDTTHTLNHTSPVIKPPNPNQNSRRALSFNIQPLAASLLTRGYCFRFHAPLYTTYYTYLCC